MVGREREFYNFCYKDAQLKRGAYSRWGHITTPYKGTAYSKAFLGVESALEVCHTYTPSVVAQHSSMDEQILPLSPRTSTPNILPQSISRDLIPLDLLSRNG